jgi:hypothetical protein
MKKIELIQFNIKKKPLIVIDASLDKYKNDVPCPEKVEMANHMLKTNNFFDKMGKKEKITKP